MVSFKTVPQSPRQQPAWTTRYNFLSGILGLAVELTNFPTLYVFTYRYARVLLNGVVEYIIFKTLLLSPLKYLGHHLKYRFPKPDQSVFLKVGPHERPEHGCQSTFEKDG